MNTFKNRTEAGRRLAAALSEYRGLNPLVLAIPRGAVPMAAEVAAALDGDLDVVLAHKIPAPGNPEFAIGAVSESGRLYWIPELTRLPVSEDYIEQEVARQKNILQKKRIDYSRIQAPFNPQGRITIVVDNGVATGATTIAALRETRARGPSELVAAMAVAPPSVMRRLRYEADRVVVLSQPEDFQAVGQFFEDFSQVTDEEVVRILKEFPTRRLGFAHR